MRPAARASEAVLRSASPARGPARPLCSTAPPLLRIGGVPEHFNYPARLAAADVGAAFRWSEFPGGSGDLAAALRADELDGAIVLTEAAALFAHRREIVVVGAYTKTPLTWGVHASAAREPVPLDEATFAVSRMGSGSHLMALVDARSRGAPPPKFEVVGNLEGARKALADGSADVFLWEKFTTKPLVDSGEWLRVGEVPTPWPCFAVVATRDAVQNRALDLGAALRAIHGYAATMPSRSAEIAAEYGQKPADVDAWLDTVAWAPFLTMPAAVLRSCTDALVDAAVLHESDVRPYPDLVADFTRDEPLDEPPPSLVEIRLEPKPKASA